MASFVFLICIYSRIFSLISSQIITEWIQETNWILPDDIADAACGYDSYTNKIYLYGGITGSNAYNAVFSFNFNGVTTYRPLQTDIGSPFWYFAKTYIGGPYFYFYANNSFGQFHTSNQTITYPLRWNNNQVPILTSPYSLDYAHSCLEITNDGRYLIVLGGDNMANMQIYDTYTQIWLNNAAAMQETRRFFTCTMDNNNVLYAIGGDARDNIEYVDVSDINNIGSWQYIAGTLNQPTKDLRSVLYENYIYIVGGRFKSKSLSFVYSIDTNTQILNTNEEDLWFEVEAMCLVVANHRIWILGGDDDWEAKKNWIMFTNSFSSSPTTSNPTTSIPTVAISTTSNSITSKPTTISPTITTTLTLNPTTIYPTTVQPSFNPSTSNPTTNKPSENPSVSPTTSEPTKNPSISPTISEPSGSPSFNPTGSPTTYKLTTYTLTTSAATTNTDTATSNTATTTNTAKSNTVTTYNKDTTLKSTDSKQDEQGEVRDYTTSASLDGKEKNEENKKKSSMTQYMIISVMILSAAIILFGICFICFCLKKKQNKKKHATEMKAVSSISHTSNDIELMKQTPDENNKHHNDYQEFATPIFGPQTPQIPQTPQFPVNTDDLIMTENDENDENDDSDEGDEDLWINTNHVTIGGDDNDDNDDNDNDNNNNNNAVTAGAEFEMDQNEKSSDENEDDLYSKPNLNEEATAGNED